jgi:hypothetical protein
MESQVREVKGEGQDGRQQGGRGCATKAILVMMKTVGQPGDEDDLTII